MTRGTRALLLLALPALACGRASRDPTIASAPAQAGAYLRVRSLEELTAAFPPARFLLREGGDGPSLAGSRLPMGEVDPKRPLGLGLTGDGFAAVLPLKAGATPPAGGSDGLETSLLGDGALAVWTGARPVFAPLEGDALPEGLLTLRFVLPRLVERFDAEIGKGVAAIHAASLLAGGSAGEPPAQAAARWKERLRSLGTIDLSLESVGRQKLEAHARVKPSEGGGLARFALAAKAAPHTLAGYLTKAGVLFFAEVSMDRATADMAPLDPPFAGVGPLPLAVAGDFGALVEEAEALGDGREVLAIGTAEGKVFLERIRGLRDGAAAAAWLRSERLASAIEEALSSVPALTDVVVDREAFLHEGIAVTRVRFALREGILPASFPAARALDSLGSACGAVAGGLLVCAEGADSEQRIRALIDRVRSGRLDRPDLAASLGASRTRLLGFALQVGEAAGIAGASPLGRFGGKLSAVLEARHGALEVRGAAEWLSPVPAGMPGLSR